MRSSSKLGGAIVTGGSGALGTAIARALLDAGSDVTLVARNQTRLQATAASLGHVGKVHTVPADVTVAADRRRIITEARERMGSIGVLVNNAGAEHIGRLGQHDLADVEHMVNMNLVAPVELSRLALPHLEAADGHIVNVVTMAAKTPMTPMSVYAATKSGLGRFSELLDLELADSPVSVAAVYPGAIAGDGMFATMQAETGVEFPKRMPLSTPDWVASKVMKAVRKRRRETYAAPSGAAMARHPRLAGRMLSAMGVADAFARVADTRAAQRNRRPLDVASCAIETSSSR